MSLFECANGEGEAIHRPIIHAPIDWLGAQLHARNLCETIDLLGFHVYNTLKQQGHRGIDGLMRETEASAIGCLVGLCSLVSPSCDFARSVLAKIHGSSWWNNRRHGRSEARGGRPQQSSEY